MDFDVAIERAAGRLGAWWAGDGSAVPGEWTLTRGSAGCKWFTARTWQHRGWVWSPAGRLQIDARTAAIALIAHVRMSTIDGVAMMVCAATPGHWHLGQVAGSLDAAREIADSFRARGHDAKFDEDQRGFRVWWRRQANHSARASLQVASDSMVDVGDFFGEALAMWLAGFPCDEDLMVAELERLGNQPEAATVDPA